MNGDVSDRRKLELDLEKEVPELRKSQYALSKAIERRRVDVKATQREAIEELLFAEPPEELSDVEMQHLVDVIKADSQAAHFLNEDK